MDIHLLVDPTGSIKGWSEDVITADGLDTVKITVDRTHNFLQDSTGYTLVGGQLAYDDSLVLAQAKLMKIEYLRAICQREIERGFKYSYNQVLYHFSLDSEAQFNFSSAYQLFMDDLITEITWTITVDGVYGRLVVDKQMMKDISLLILQHKTYNIGKLRDVLAIQVTNATSLSELEAITW